METSPARTISLPLVECEPYSARLAKGACVSRYRAAKAEHCIGCRVGARRAGVPLEPLPTTMKDALARAMRETAPYRVDAHAAIEPGGLGAIHLQRRRRPPDTRTTPMDTKTQARRCKRCDAPFQSEDSRYRYCPSCSSPRWNMHQAAMAACRILRFFGFQVETVETPGGVAILVRARPKDNRPRSGKKKL